MCGGGWEYTIDRQIGVASVLMRPLCQSIGIKEVLSHRVKISFYRLMFVLKVAVIISSGLGQSQNTLERSRLSPGLRDTFGFKGTEQSRHFRQFFIELVKDFYEFLFLCLELRFDLSEYRCI